MQTAKSAFRSEYDHKLDTLEFHHGHKIWQGKVTRRWRVVNVKSGKYVGAFLTKDEAIASVAPVVWK